MAQLSRMMCSLLLFCFLCYAIAEDPTNEKKPKDWKKKDVTDYNDGDLEKLYEQWEEGEEDLPEDELPHFKREPPKIDVSKLDPNDPEGLLRASKKGRTVMMFASVSGNPSERETSDITQLWQSSLFNAHYETQRYVVGANRVMFMLQDGSNSPDIKNFLVEQERCSVVTIEGKDFYGKGHELYGQTGNMGEPVNKVKKPKLKKKVDKKDKKMENTVIKDDKDEL